MITKADCLKHCYERDINWLEGGIDLYSILDRVSCWCCCNKNLKELKNYMIHLPEYWKKLKELQDQTERPMKYNKYRVEDLELRFKEELKKKEYTKMKKETLKGIEWMFENEFNDMNNDNHAVNRTMLRTMLWENGNYQIELDYDLDRIIIKARIFKKIYQTEGINND